MYADAKTEINQILVADQTAAVLMSHNYSHDLAVLAKLLPTNIPYVGVLGPRKRFEKMQTEWGQARIFLDGL